MQTITITSRTRNLGYGWTTAPDRTAKTASILPVTAPIVKGGIKAVETELERRRKVTSGGTWYNEALFVGGKPVDTDNSQSVDWILSRIRATGSCTVTLKA